MLKNARVWTSTKCTETQPTLIYNDNKNNKKKKNVEDKKEKCIIGKRPALN
jgi:hypothetical protein